MVGEVKGGGKLTLGIDLGSNTVKAVALRGGQVVGSQVVRSSWDLEGVTRECIEACLAPCGQPLEAVARVVATGYGRVSCSLAQAQVSEITCHARGAFFLSPQVRTVIDIGGQDSKVISLGETGKPLDFAMNDKCAAGTGRFLEVQAGALGVGLTELAGLAALAKQEARISNTCAVFAESEVISLMARRVPMPEIVAGLHSVVASRAMSLVHRVRVQDQVMMTGGVAMNAGVHGALAKALGRRLVVPAQPQLVGALGAALIAAEQAG